MGTTDALSPTEKVTGFLHMCSVWVYKGELDERKKCPYMIPTENQAFCYLKTFCFEVHQYVPGFLILP